MRWVLLVALLASACHRGAAPTESPERTAVAPGATVVDGAGGTVPLESLRREVTVVGLWASYCGPCRSELPVLELLAQRLADDPQVAVVALSIIDGAATLHSAAITQDPPEARLDAYAQLIERARLRQLPSRPAQPSTNAMMELRPVEGGLRLELTQLPGTRAQAIDTIVEFATGLGIADTPAQREQIGAQLDAGERAFVLRTDAPAPDPADGRAPAPPHAPVGSPIGHTTPVPPSPQ